MDRKLRIKITRIKRTSIETNDNNASSSPIELIELGKLLLASMRNNNNNLKTKDMKKNISISLLLVLLITNPTNKESPIDDKL